VAPWKAALTPRWVAGISFATALPAHSGPWPLIQFRNHFSQTAGFLGRVISPPQGRYLNTGLHKHRINAYTQQTSVPWVGFEPTIPASEQAERVHGLDRAATATSSRYTWIYCSRRQHSRHGTASSDNSIHVSPSHNILLSFILMLSSHLFLGIQPDNFSRGSPFKTVYALLSPS
jgi:hypothetical protein